MRDVGRFFRSEWDRAVGYGCLLAGAVALAVGIGGVRHAADIVDEISYLVSGGIGAIFLLGVGATLLLSADLHDDFRKLDRVEGRLQAIQEALGQEPDLPGPPPAAAEPSPDSGKRLRRTRRVSAGAIGAAGVLFLAGVVMVANEADPDQLTPGVGLALAGALLAATVGGGAIGHLKGNLERRQLAVLGPWAGSSAATDRRSTTAEAPADRVWVADGLSLYHRDGCQALAGRAVQPRARRQLESGARPCGLCEPDGR